MLLAIALLSSSAQAEQIDRDDFIDIPLKELSQIKVSVASFRDENLDWSSAVVTRYDRDAMNKLGIRSIPDLLALVPGVVIQTNQRGSEQVMVRGITDSWNQKVLFLLDDTPYWMPSHGEIPLRGIPFIAIDHVEVIRGPGAVVHGSNATAAVIKIVTRKDSKIDMAAATGERSMHDASLYAAKSIDNFSINISLQDWNESDTHSVISGLLAPPTTGNITLGREGKSGLLNAFYNNVSVTLHHFETTYAGIDGYSSATNFSSMLYEGDLASIHWKGKWRDISIELHSDYNLFTMARNIEDIALPIGIDAGTGSIELEKGGDDNYRWRSGGIAHYQSKDHVVTLGYDYEERSTERLAAFAPGAFGSNLFANLIRPERSVENTVYLQDDWSFNNWRIVSGVRYVATDEYDEQWLPRLTAMYRIDNTRTIRALYGVGFNSPSFAQQGNELTNVIKPITDGIQPEKIETTELAYREQYDNWFWGVNVYYFEAQDFINPVFDLETTRFVNAENFDRYGAEIEYQWAFTRTTFFGNIAYQHQGDTEIAGDPTALLVPKVTLVAGVEYHHQQHAIGASFLHHSKRQLASELNQLDINYGYHIKRWHFAVTAKNLLNDDIIVQDSRNLAIIQQDSHRQLIAEVRYTY